jgi:hypothetical protein
MLATCKPYDPFQSLDFSADTATRFIIQVANKKDLRAAFVTNICSSGSVAIIPSQQQRLLCFL